MGALNSFPIDAFSPRVYGKYINQSDENAVNFIVINKDGTYQQYYKKAGQPEKINKGYWNLYKKESCQINFDSWKDIVGYIKQDEVSHNYAHYRNNKLMFFEDIDDAEYAKEE